MHRPNSLVFFGILVTAAVIVGCDSRPATDADLEPRTPETAAPGDAVTGGSSAGAGGLARYAKDPMATLATYDFDFSLTSTEGRPVSKADFAGKVLVVDLWATWCGPCRVEVPHFVELQSELEDQGLAMVGINYESANTPQEAIAAIEEFTAEVPVNYPLVLGDEATMDQLPRQFRGIFPTTLFLDRTGQVRLTIAGAREKEELRKIMLALLQESP